MSAAKRLGLGMVIVFLGTAGLLAGWLAWQITAHGVAATDAGLRMAAPWFLALRVGMLTAIVGGWPWWVRWIARRDRWPAARSAYFLALRWRAAAWLTAIEILMVQDGFGRLVRALVN